MTEQPFDSPRVIRVRSGRVEPRGSWLYVWIDIADDSIAYVGATGLDPELRAHVHLTSDNPAHGRVRATVPSYETRDFDVLAFPLPSATDRPVAKQALLNELAVRGLFPAAPQPDSEVESLPSIAEPIADAIERYRSTASNNGRSHFG